MTRRFLVHAISSIVCAVVALMWISPNSHAQATQPADAIVKSLQKGGYVIVMRHASSPRTVPDKATANPDNTTPERQLDAAGRDSATAMGKAMRDLKIPVGEVLTSPTYRAKETVKYAQWPNPKPAPELGDGGQNMAATSGAGGDWLKKQSMQLPTGTNTILVTHMPNLMRTFPEYATGVADGEALVFGPDGKGGSTLLGRIKIDQWTDLAKKNP